MSGVEAAISFGVSILAIASAGISVATTLMCFSVSYKGSAEKIENLSGRVSLTATILTTVGNTIENHQDYFKEDNFREKFGRVTDRCKKDYGILGVALSKAKGEVGDLGSDRRRQVKAITPWKKLIWALGGEERMKDLQSSLEESKTQVLMMQSAASLIVLQILGKRRTLTEDETNDLAELKQKMGMLLLALTEAKILSMIPVKSPNHQVLQQRSLSNDELNQQMKDKDVIYEKRPASRQERRSDENESGEIENRSSPCSTRRSVHEDEIHSSTENFSELNSESTKTHHRICALMMVSQQLKIEFKALITRIRGPPIQQKKESSTLERLTAVSSVTVSTISQLLSIRNDITQHTNPPRTWGIELLMPWSSIPRSDSQNIRRINAAVDPGYLLIIRCPANEISLNTPRLHSNPFPVTGPMTGILRIGSLPSRGQGATIPQGLHGVLERRERDRRQYPLSKLGISGDQEISQKATGEDDADANLSQKEAETAVNDFLVTFSALYDSVPVEERTAVLDVILIDPLVYNEEEGDDYQSIRSI